MNALEEYRTKHGLTFQALGDLAGFQKPTAYRHCCAAKVPAEAAIIYSVRLGIPLVDLRPEIGRSTSLNPVS